MAKKITAKFNVCSKVDNKSLPHFELDHPPKEHANFLKKYKPCLGNFVWSDFIPDEDYEKTGEGQWEDAEMTVINSTAKLKYIEIKKKMYAILLSGEVEIEFEDKAQSERFLDKEWSQEWIIPSLDFEPLKSGDKAFSISSDMDRDLYTLDYA